LHDFDLTQQIFTFIVPFLNFTESQQYQPIFAENCAIIPL